MLDLDSPPHCKSKLGYLGLSQIFESTSTADFVSNSNNNNNDNGGGGGGGGRLVEKRN